MSELIFVIRWSLHYEEREPVFYRITRERYGRHLSERKEGKMLDYYFQRVTPSAWEREFLKDQRTRLGKQYDKAIMAKYNVGPDYRGNRWFMEQVRPFII